MPVELNFSIYDGKGARSLVKFNMEDGFSIADYTEVAVAMLAIVKGMTDGAVVSAGLCLNLALGGLDAVGDALATSDVEEGARFIYGAGVYNTAVRIPTFNEGQIVPSTRIVDETAPTVSAFINAMQDGVVTAGGTVEFTDYRGEDIDKLNSAIESFQRSRR